MNDIRFDSNTKACFVGIAEAIKKLAKAQERIAMAQEAANEIEKRKVTTHSLTTVYLEDEIPGDE